MSQKSYIAYKENTKEKIRHTSGSKNHTATETRDAAHGKAPHKIRYTPIKR